MPGAGSFIAVNTCATLCPRTAREMAIGAPTIALDEVLGTPERTLQDRRTRLDRPHRFSDQHRVHVAHLEGEDLRRRAEIRIDPVGDRRGFDRVDLSDGDEQRVRNEVQAGHGLQGFGRSAACGRARRGRGSLDLLDRGEGRPSGMVAEEDHLDPRAVRAHPPSGAAGHSDRRRTGPQRRGEAGAERHHGRGRGRLGLLHHARRAARAARRAAARLRRHHAGPRIPGGRRQDQTRRWGR